MFSISCAVSCVLLLFFVFDVLCGLFRSFVVPFWCVCWFLGRSCHLDVLGVGPFFGIRGTAISQLLLGGGVVSYIPTVE